MISKNSTELVKEEIRRNMVRRSRAYRSISSANERARKYVDNLTDEDIRKYLEDKRKKRIREINVELERNRNSILRLEAELKKLS